MTQPYLALANFYIRTGVEPAEAEQIFPKALTATHEDVGVLQARLSYYEDLGKWDDAEKVVRTGQGASFFGAEILGCARGLLYFAGRLAKGESRARAGGERAQEGRS